MNKALKRLAVTGAFISAAFALNDNKVAAQGATPNGFVPKAPITHIDSTTKGGNDTLRAEFKANKTDADTGVQKKVITPDMSADDKAQIFSMNNDAIGIFISKGKDMAHYTDEELAANFEKFCRERGVQAKAFVDSRKVNEGNTIYAGFINGHVAFGLVGGKEVFDNEKGLPFAVSVQKGYDIRKRKAVINGLREIRQELEQ